MGFSLSTLPEVNTMWKGRPHSSTTAATASCHPSKHLLSSSPPTGNELEDSLHSKALHSLQQKHEDDNFWWNDPYWLNTAFDGDVPPMAVDRGHEHPRYLQQPGGADYDQAARSLFETNDEGVYIEIRTREKNTIRASPTATTNEPPSKIRRLELSTRAFLDAVIPSLKVSEIPGLLPDSVLDAWEQPLIFPKRDAGQDRLWLASAPHAKKPLFRFVLDPPEGAESCEIRPLKKRCADGDAGFDEKLLLPPQKQYTRRDRKKEELRMKIRLGRQRIKCLQR